MNSLEQLQKEIEILKQERDYYKNILINNSIEFKPFDDQNNKKMSMTDKINIYMNYFKGRTDVYAQRWETQGKNGYSPVCGNKSILGLCDIAKYKCKNCPNQIYKQLTEKEIIEHIRGNITIGIYPMLDDDTCNFIAVDFDETDYKESVNAFIDECSLYNLDYLVEISRSGNGAHVWIFFENQYSAFKIRKIISNILTSAMIKTGKISFSSYDRMFPSQDKLLKNGIGNLIALPLNGKRGSINTTVFVNKQFIPYENQFEILKNTKKISTSYLDELFKKMSTDKENGLFGEEIKKYKLLPNDFNETITIDIENEIKLTKKQFTNKVLKYFMRMSSFLNQKYFKNQASRVSVYNVPKIISLYKIDDDYLYLPRGLFDQIIDLVKNLKIKYIINDKRIKGDNINVSFNGTLKEEQKLGLNQLLNKDNGIFVAPTGFGKTVVATALISNLKVNTLILVNNNNLCNQWNERLKKFLNLNYETNTENKIGIIHSKLKEITNKIDIALIQSLASSDELRNSMNKYGLIIFDEVHHLAAVSYEKVMRSFSAKYIYGFTATPNRSDGYEKINYMVVGPCLFNYNYNENKSYTKILYPHFTKLKLQPEDKLLSITEIDKKLIENDERNKQIINDIKKSIEENKKILVLTNRVEHAKKLYNEIKNYINNVFLIYGSISKSDKEQFNEKLNNINDEQFVIVSTGKYIGEGFDEKRLDTLFLTMPFKWRGTLKQYVGRLHRDNDNKFQVEVHDYIDINIPVLFRMYSERQKGYKELNYISIAENSKKEVLFDDDNYYDELVEDLKDAQNIKFYIQYANIEKLNILIEKCKIKPNIYSSELIDNINTVVNPNININIIIINDNTLWYGGINPFIYKKDNLTIARLEDKEICTNIMMSFNTNK